MRLSSSKSLSAAASKVRRPCSSNASWVMPTRNSPAIWVLSLHRDGHAAIDGEHLPVAVARCIGGEIDGGPAQLLGIAPAPQGRAAGDPVVEFLVGAHAGIGLARIEARPDAVDVDAMRPELDRQSARQPVNPRL